MADKAKKNEPVRTRMFHFALFAFFLGALDFFFFPGAAFEGHWKVAITGLIAMAGFAMTITSIWVAVVYKDLLGKVWSSQPLDDGEQVLSDSFGSTIMVSTFTMLSSGVAIVFSPGISYYLNKHQTAQTPEWLAFTLAEIPHALFSAIFVMQASVFIYALLPLFVARQRGKKALARKKTEQLDQPVRPPK